MKKNNNGIKPNETQLQWYQRLNNHFTDKKCNDFLNIKVGNRVLFANGKTSFVSAVYSRTFEVSPILGLKHDPVLLIFQKETSDLYPTRRSVFHSDEGYEPVCFFSGQLQTTLF